MRNALDAALRDALIDACAIAAADPSITDVQLDGAGPAFCTGGELAAFAHRVIAREDATFALPEVGMRLVPGAGGTVSITKSGGSSSLRLVGDRRRDDRLHHRAWVGLVDEIAE